MLNHASIPIRFQSEQGNVVVTVVEYGLAADANLAVELSCLTVIFSKLVTEVEYCAQQSRFQQAHH